MVMFQSIAWRTKQRGQKLAAVLGRWVERASGGGNKTPIFIVGCQRSGTTMFIRVLRKCSRTDVYGESNEAAFSEGCRIRSDATLRSVIGNSRESIIVFKPLNDTQNTDKLLQVQPNAKAILIYRHFHDVVNSLIQKWGDAQKEAVHQIATGRYSGPGSEALGERISAENLALAQRLDKRGLSDNDAAAFIWFLRNSLYFDLKLDANSSVLLCNYEEMVTDPDWYFRRVFDFIDAKYSSRYVADVACSSIHKHNPPVMSEEIEKLCEGLMDRLNAQHKLHFSMEHMDARVADPVGS